MAKLDVSSMPMHKTMVRQARKGREPLKQRHEHMQELKNPWVYLSGNHLLDDFRGRGTTRVLQEVFTFICENGERCITLKGGRVSSAPTPSATSPSGPSQC
jgi:hypothetical protein